MRTRLRRDTSSSGNIDYCDATVVLLSLHLDSERLGKSWKRVQNHQHLVYHCIFLFDCLLTCINTDFCGLADGHE